MNVDPSSIVDHRVIVALVSIRRISAVSFRAFKKDDPFIVRV
jgi:hypothetical protein